jgi:hypothetical protein
MKIGLINYILNVIKSFYKVYNGLQIIRSVFLYMFDINPTYSIEANN